MTSDSNTSDPGPERQDRPEQDAQPQQVKLTIASGGYVLIIMAFICVALVAWAVYPALMQAGNRPPGDGETIESYGFDISNLELDRAYIDTPLLHRDMTPVMDEPQYLSAADVEALEGREKYLVSTDRVVGVNLNGESRAYPISILNVHEIIHDTLGGTPIAVTYSWPCDSVVVFDRRYQGETLQFGVSGLLFHANMMFYDRQETVGGESLFVQLQGKAVSGPRKDQVLRRLHYQLVDWQTWLRMHPHTMVVARDDSMLKRYKDAAPTSYFLTEELEGFKKVAPLPADSPWGPKTRVVAVHNPRESLVFAYPWLKEHRNENNRVPSPVPLGDILFEYHVASDTVQVQWLPERATLHATHCFWFAWKAMYPDAALRDRRAQPSP